MAAAAARSEPKYSTKQEARSKTERKQDVIDREIERLHSKLGHVPTSQEILEAATKKNHALHPYFTWDNDAAAARWRLEEAARMLMSSKFVVQLQSGSRQRVEVRKFVLINKGEPMRLRNEAIGEPSSCEKMVAQAMTELRSWCRRYSDVPDLESVRGHIEKLVS